MSRPRFLYHAYAVGVTGRVNEHIIEPQVASALPPAGGHGAATWKNYQLRRQLSYDLAMTSTAGRFHQEADTHETVTSATISGFNLGDTIVASKISAHLTSVHSAIKDEEPRFALTGTKYEGLVIAGETIEAESLVDRYSELSTFQAVKDFYLKSPATLDAEMQRKPEPSLADRIRSYFPWCGKPSKPGELPCHRDVTIVPLFLVRNKDIPGKFAVFGNVIHVFGFGFIQLGELAISSDERRVTMLQVDLDPVSDTSDENAVRNLSFGPGGSGGNTGNVTCASVGSNGGQTDPPLGS